MNWLIPLDKKGTSGAYNVNFVVEDNGIYVSDNHRIALWCWMQHLKPNQNIALFHIDRHYDTGKLNGPYITNFPGVFNLKTFREYLDLDVKICSLKTPLIRWDNYLSYFISDKALENHIEGIYLATHEEGSYPDNPFDHQLNDIKPYELLNSLESAINLHEKIIVNIDLDYFFIGEHENYFKFIDDAFITKLFRIVKAAIDSKKITCLTLCLSPECCGDLNGSWGNSEYVLNIAKKELGIKFSL